MLGGHRLFFGQYIRHFRATGAVSPSGRRLAEALARFVPAAGRPRRVLEVGPGTGAVTTRIVADLGTQDRLDLVELNDRFVEHLQRRFQNEPAFAKVADRAQLIHRPLEELPCQPVYDLIVSGLPLNNFSADEVEEFLQLFSRMLVPGGILSFFEYIGVRSAKALIGGRQERERLRRISRILGDSFKRYEFRRDCVWPNVPPAWVHHLRFHAANGQPDAPAGA